MRHGRLCLMAVRFERRRSSRRSERDRPRRFSQPGVDYRRVPCTGRHTDTHVRAARQCPQECELTICRFLAAVLTFLAFTLGMVYPVTINSSGKVSLRVAVTGITAVPSPRARFGAWLPTSLKRNATTFSLFFMALAAASTFTLAAWQHLAAACFTGLAEDLAFGAIVGHTGPVAAALAWLSFVCAALCTVLLGLEKGLRSKISKDEVPSMEAPGESRFGDGVESQLGQDATQLDPEEQPPLRNPDSWQQAPSIPLYHVLQFMGYTPTGRRGEWETRQQNTAAWVRRGEMSHGFAETIVEGEDE
ncbi:hypothetical protein JDV02_008391 [Purpureocillium takamizusanense]|uniref:Uncharacterized protein n=1 Tax=Purpureocillium takamizusanense TaxID=2060973 RepID=A0A9Q8VEN7_9HYPO|nr:uncharacterized protein JDV02_008391 [Purpureocillium takamizusanense]UNI22506.1 hypothetical protein JDV02_008391 [Purpureocillium takamizusanense]